MTGGMTVPGMRRHVSLVATACCIVVAGTGGITPAAQAFRLGKVLTAITANPAEQLLSTTIEDETYEPATRCTPKVPRPGLEKLEAWLTARGEGESWGSYRCERWGAGQASLHAERRALDWHLDVGNPVQRAQGRRLIELLLRPDSDGNAHALARRMGIEEIIWDCSYWSAGSADFLPYSACYSRRGTPKRHVDRTTAHKDHIHLGLTRAGANGRTSFWAALQQR